MEENDKNLIPAVWYIKPKTKYEEMEMIKWRGNGYLGEFGTSYLLSEKYWSSCPNSGDEITFEQFEKYVLGRQPTKNKEIFGYKLLKELPFVKPGIESYLNSDNECVFETNSVSTQDAFVFTKEELEEKPDWFEPIYKEHFKAGDWVVIKNFKQAGEGNGIIKKDHVCQLLDINFSLKHTVTGILKEHRDFIVEENGLYYGIKKKHIIRRATPEEIENFKTKTFKLSNGKEVRINKKGIYADGVKGEISILGLKNLLRPGQTSLNFLTVELKDATFKIGCWENVKFSEIKEMLEIYENLQK
jgi:hypothetical protein